jgi:PAS domain-containing protein
MDDAARGAWRLWGLGALLLGPVGGVLAGLMAEGQVAFLPGAVLLAGMIAAVTAVLWRWRADERALSAYVARLHDPSETTGPPPMGLWGERTAAALARARQEWVDERAARARHAAISQATMDALDDPLLALRADRSVAWANRAARDLLGERMVGATWPSACVSLRFWRMWT